MNAKKNKLAILEGWLSIFTNIILFGLKYWAGIVTGSVAIIADAWHTLSDSISSVIVLLGIKISDKPADKEHPFGHGRAELIASTIIGVLLAIIAFNFVQESIEKLKDHESVVYGKLAIIVTVVSILAKELLAQYAFWAGKKTNSSVLKADGWHHRTDAISSVLILIGIFVGKYFWWIDGVLGLAVAALIFYAAYEILRDAVDSLLGEEPTEEFIEELKAVAEESVDIDPGIHHIHLHKYGNHTEVTFHIELPREMTLEEVHNISEAIENALREKLNICPTIHADPKIK